MTTVRAIIDRALTLLQDNEPGFESTTWTRASLLDWLNEGLRQIAAARPDLFTSVEPIPLRSGTLQRVPDAYVAIYAIEGNLRLNADGAYEIAVDVTVADSAMLRRFKKKPCLLSECGGDAATGYVVRTFVRSPYNQQDFRVEPPVPEGATVEVMASVLKRPAEYTLGDIDKEVELSCPNEAALLDWIMHRAYTMETESAYARNAKLDHIRLFYTALNLNYNADGRMTSGYVLGQTGTGERSVGPQRDIRNTGIAQ